MLFWRSDGTRLRGLDPMRRMLPMLMPTRNEAIVYYEQIVDATAMTAYIQRWNRGDGAKLTPLHLVVASLGRVLKARPQLDRFVAGRRLWQRKVTSISFAAKKEFADHAPLKTVKLPVVEGEALGDTLGRIREEVGGSRTRDDRPVDKEMSLLGKLPDFLLSPVVRSARFLDRWNMLPRALMKDDPLFSSVFVANLGSLGIDAFTPALNPPQSAVLGVGRMRKQPVVLGNEILPRELLSLSLTFDHRVVDGAPAARFLETLCRLIASAEIGSA